MISSGLVAVTASAVWWFVPPTAWTELISDVGDWFAAHHDAGDWIAFGALVVAVLGFWQSRVAARAAKTSADASVESAKAAHRSADIADAVRRREEAPTWDIAFERVEDGICVVCAVMRSGPVAIDVQPLYRAQFFGDFEPSGTKLKTASTANELDMVQDLHKGGRVTFPLLLPEDIGEVRSINLTVVLSSVESRDPGPDGERWDYAETLRWKAPPLLGAWR